MEKYDFGEMMKERKAEAHAKMSRIAESNDADNETKESSDDSEDPCWENYEQIGMKEKDGKEVPNCVPKDKKD